MIIKTIDLSLHLMDSRTILTLFSILFFQLYSIRLFFKQILFWIKFSSSSRTFKSYSVREKNEEEHMREYLIFYRDASLQPPGKRLRTLTWLLVQPNPRDTVSFKIKSLFGL